MWCVLWDTFTDAEKAQLDPVLVTKQLGSTMLSTKFVFSYKQLMITSLNMKISLTAPLSDIFTDWKISEWRLIITEFNSPIHWREGQQCIFCVLL